MNSKKITLGILAHVDAGKTTLSEALLYLTGELRKPGRVDHGDAFLDDDPIEYGQTDDDEDDENLSMVAEDNAEYKVGDEE